MEQNQIAFVIQLLNLGWTEYEIIKATGFNEEFIKQILQKKITSTKNINHKSKLKETLIFYFQLEQFVYSFNNDLFIHFKNSIKNLLQINEFVEFTKYSIIICRKIFNHPDLLNYKQLEQEAYTEIISALYNIINNKYFVVSYTNEQIIDYIINSIIKKYRNILVPT